MGVFRKSNLSRLILGFGILSANANLSAEPKTILAAPEIPRKAQSSEFPTPTPTPYPTLPPPPMCPIYRIDGLYIQNGPGGLLPYFIPSPETPSCVYKEVEKATLACILRLEGGTFLDDCVVRDYFRLNPTYPGRDFITSPWHPEWRTGCMDGMCNTATYFFDENCKRVTGLSPEQISTSCKAGLISALASPISLIWEDGYDIEKNLAVSAFPLDPKRSGGFYTWKASSKSPLLVYDPTREGKVVSSFQLFGEWAFGGKQKVSLLENLIENENSFSQPTPWSNGYEALSTLDTNNNQKVDGEELDVLSLWFDNNRDGISQPGEVKTLEAVGVSALYYTGAVREPVSRSLKLHFGYERNLQVRDGERKITGASVDWYAEYGATPGELINKHQVLSNACQENRGESDLPDRSKQENFAASTTGSKITGGWRWHVSGNNDAKLVEAKAEGVIVLEEKGQKRLQGHSFLSSGLNGKATGAAAMLQILPLTGEVIQTADSEIKVEFTVSGLNGMKLQSRAVLSADGSEMTGKTEATMPSGSQTFQYAWVARKITVGRQ